MNGIGKVSLGKKKMILSQSGSHIWKKINKRHARCCDTIYLANGWLSVHEDVSVCRAWNWGHLDDDDYTNTLRDEEEFIMGW